ncbi:MAG: hypothetical protein H6719_10450 [Sandaracinaceae bacterium]|nr:hypothetical protein [Sandaracinaceae bacterium]
MLRTSALAFASLLLVACNSGPPPIPPLPDAGPRFDAGAGDSGAGASCDNRVFDGDESAVDCGGSCPPCADGDSCRTADDCESGVCTRGRCLVPTCTDGVRNGRETGRDCGGDCGLCPGGEPCSSNDQCLSGRCRGGMCTMSDCEDGSMNGEETDVDCGGSVCPACNGGLVCDDNTDCTSLICAAGTCTDAACNDSVQNQDETSVDCGGGVCPGCRDGLACNVDADCEGRRCLDGGCVSCMDRVRDAEETDVDCGGGLCDPCADGDMCLVDSDCESNSCIGGVCLSCVDGVMNQDETDIDCGGTACPGCPDRGVCLVDSDCASGDCLGGACVSCMDSVRNRDETDVDCGGTLCPGCAPGRMCAVPSDCMSMLCDGPTGLCNAPGCGDGVTNAEETDLDCGGSMCIGCMTGQRCVLARDCLDGVCMGNMCRAPTCSDGVANGDETDIDCGGSSGCPRCPDRARCDDASDCTAGVCTVPPGRCGTFAGCYWGLISQETQFTDTTIQGLFTTNGHSFDVLSNNGTTGVHTSSATTLAGYTHLVFHQHDRVLSATELAALSAWVEAGGRLIVTGYDSLGSPTDAPLAGLVRCSAPGDGPFGSAMTVVDATHRIMRGPAQTFTMGEALTAASTDHDQCTPTGGSVRLIELSGTSKLNIAEGIGAGRGMVVYWNGNGSGSGALLDWTGPGGTQPALQNLFVNVLDYLCSAP